MTMKSAYMRLQRNVVIVVFAGFTLILNQFGALVMGQGQPHQEEITVVAPFEPTIADAMKISMNPVTSDTTSLKKDFTYNILSSILVTPFTVTALKPARLAGEPLTKLYSNYLRAGMGTYTSPFVDYYYNSQRAKDLNYAVRIRHFSSRGDLPEVGFPGTSSNHVGFNIRQIGKKGHTKWAGISYNRDVYHFYGFPAMDSMPEPGDYRQRYQQLGLELGAFRHDIDKRKIHYDARLNIHHLNNLSESRALTAGISALVGKQLDFLDFSDRQEIAVTTAAELDQTVLADSNQGLVSLITIQPVFKARMGEFELHAGLRADVMTDTASELMLSPVIGVKIDVIDQALSISFGMNGDVSHMNIKRLMGENPYIGNHIPRYFQKNKLRIYGNLDGRLGRKIGFHTGIAVSKLDNAGFFVNDTLVKPWRPFTLVLDNVNLFEANAAFTFDWHQKWQSRLLMKYQHYSLGNATPWHIPEFTTAFLLSYKLGEKFLVRTELFGATERLAREYDLQGNELTVTLPGYLDLNAGVEYRYSKILSGFLEVNNIINRHYYVWNGYPVQGLRVMAGFTYAF